MELLCIRYDWNVCIVSNKGVNWHCTCTVSPYSQLKERWVSHLTYCQKATYCYMWQQCIYGHVTVSKTIPLYNLSGCIYFDVVRETPKKRMLRFNWNINLVAVKRQNRCCLKCKAVYCGIDALCLFPRGQWPDNRSNSDWIVFVTGVKDTWSLIAV